MKKKYYLLLSAFNIFFCTCLGQTSNLCTHCPLVNNLIINNGYNPVTQTSLLPGQQDLNWIVTAITADMQNAFCNSNTTGATPPAGVSVSPVAVGQPSLTIEAFPAWPQFGNYVSCFPFNTMYTNLPANSNNTNCTMDITRNFFICSNNNENIVFNLTVATDDYTRSIIIDEGTANSIVLFAGATPYNVPLVINATENLAPGMHTLTIEGANYEDVNGQYYNLPSGITAQWNPFGISIIGTISSANNVIVNNSCIVQPCTSSHAKLTGSTICDGDNAVLMFNATSASSPFNIIYNVGVNIYNQSNLTNNATFPVPYQLTDTTTFNLFSVTDANGCVDTINATTVINVNPLPQGSITANTVCSGDSAKIIFTATSGNAPFEVQLSDGTNTTTYYQVESGKSFNVPPTSNSETIYLFSITDQNGNGCSRTNGFTYPSALVNVIPSPQVQFDSVPPVCIDQPSFLITQVKEITGSSGNGVFSGQGSDANGNFSPSTAGVGNHVITFKYTSLNGCSDSASRNVVVNRLPIVNAGTDIISCIGFPVRLNATGATTYTWLPVLGLDDPNKSNPIATLDTTTTFIVQGTDPTGCFAFDTVTVEVSTKGIAAFQVPNAFTPNGDGVNDCFGIRNWGSDIIVQEFNIYNRWGQLIFATKNPSDCWDGTFKGAKQNSGGYPYIIKATSPCGNITRTGIVLLIR